MLLLIGTLLLFTALVPYLYYLTGIRFGKKTTDLPRIESYPPISVVIAAYNEEHIIKKRILNLLASSYPVDEIIIVDDCSNDATAEIAKETLADRHIQYILIQNEKRSGTNRSYNRGILKAHNDIIVTTDANKFFKPDALELVITRLISDPTIAAVCGDQQPCPSGQAAIGVMEQQYRNFYGRMCEWESAIDSTFNFNGPLVAFKRPIIGRINERKGADDANTAFEAIRKGYRAFYEIRAVVYEYVPGSLKHQYRQKIRRATRLHEAILSNLDVLGMKRPFSRIFLPMRIFMLMGSPLLFFTGIIIISVSILLENAQIALILAILLFSAVYRIKLFSSFLINQFYLLIGLLHLGRDMRIWESTN